MLCVTWGARPSPLGLGASFKVLFNDLTQKVAGLYGARGNFGRIGPFWRAGGLVMCRAHGLILVGACALEPVGLSCALPTMTL